MRKFALFALAAMFAIATTAPAPIVGMDSTAMAQKAKKEKKAKDAPGKCGTGRYFDKKSKACKSK